MTGLRGAYAILVFGFLLRTMQRGADGDVCDRLGGATSLEL
jgi:hypothetical protein